MTDQPTETRTPLDIVSTTNAEVTLTLKVDGVTKTFTGSATTGGNPGNALRGVLGAVQADAQTWSFGPLREALRDEH